MIFGSDPTKTIVDKYLTEYSCGFLNARGGTILFGVQEEKQSKIGHIVGIVIPPEKRKELVKKTVTAFSKFYPPVTTSQFRLIFHKVAVPDLNLILRSNQRAADGSDSYILLKGPSDEIGHKWPKFVKDKFKGCLCRVIPIQPEVFCVVFATINDIKEKFESLLNEFVKQNSKFSIQFISASDLKEDLKHLYIVELKIFRSQYPIHLIRPIETHVFDNHGNIIMLNTEKMMRRFELGWDSAQTFDVDRFLDHVGNFEQSGNSFMLITSPFLLATTERDLHGIVLQQWTLAIDFDQYPKQEGHLFHQFEELNDIYHPERERFIKTPHDSKLELDPEHAICWLAARGYDDIQKSMSKEGMSQLR